MATINKTQPTHDSVQTYLNSIEGQDRRKDAIELSNILKGVTGTEPIMWGTAIVGFGKYHYTYESGREGDTPAVGFSARKAALTLYGLFHYNENKQNIALASQLGPHTHGKGCLYIKDLSKINIEVLRQMISNAFTMRNNA